MKLEKIIEKIIEKIPPGWKINICLERGECWVELFDANTSIQVLPNGDKLLAGQLTEALEIATGDETMLKEK